MSFVAIMAAEVDAHGVMRLAKLATFESEAEANAHVAVFIGTYPDAFVVPEPPEPQSHWLIDMAAKTIAIVPPTLDFSAIDHATVDRLLLESGVMRALAKALFLVVNDVRVLKGENPITASQFKTFLKGLIR